MDSKQSNKTAIIASAEEEIPQNLAAQRAKYGMLIDANGNEFVVPDYTLKQIYDAIPKECFERNVFKSLCYLFQDLALITLTFLTFNKYVTPDYVPFTIVRFALWTLYSFMQMIFGCGIWILAHECGHMAFSQHKTYNDTIGLILRSALLVPYFSWKITHKYHHKGVGNMATDTAFTPLTRVSYTQGFNNTIEEVAELVEDAPIYSLLQSAAKHLFTWQLYMLTMMGVGESWFHKKAAREGKQNPERNEDGSIKRTYGLGGSLFNPYGPYFDELDTKLIFLTNAALLVTFSLLYYIGNTYG
jgi:omega-6 fatty acid desaturase (delta-12 desaturase)